MMWKTNSKPIIVKSDIMTDKGTQEGFYLRKGTMTFLMIIIAVISSIVTVVAFNVDLKAEVEKNSEAVGECKQIQIKNQEKINENEKNMAVINNKLDNINNKIDDIKKTLQQK